MKKLIFCLMIMLLPMMAQADFLGILKADEFVTLIIKVPDSAGIRTLPDSVHVLSYRNDLAGAPAYNVRSTTFPFATEGIDTTKLYGDTAYIFRDQIQDIDGTPGNPHYILSINVTMWCDDGIPFENAGYAQVINDSLQNYFDSLLNIRTIVSDIEDTTQASLDTLQRFTKRQTDSLQAVLDSLQRFTEQQTDSLQAVLDSIQNLATLTDMADSTNGRDVITRGIVSGTPNVAGFASVALTEVDDYWIDKWVKFIDGALANNKTRVSDFTAATDSLTLLPVFPEVMAVGDSFYVLGTFSESPSAGAGLDTLSTVFVDRFTGRVADTNWLSSLAARDGVAGSFGDSAQGWGATAAGGTDTANIKIMMAGNPEITSGYQVSYRGSVNDATPTNGRIIVDGIDLTKADDFYNNAGMVLVWFTGALEGESQIITDWKTTQDSLITRIFSAAPANNDSFVIVPTNLVDAYAFSGDSTAADNAELWFDGTGYNNANSTIGTATTVTGGATSANQTLIIDSVQAVLDSLQRFTERQTDSLQAILDSLQSQDNWVAQETTVQAHFDTLIYIGPRGLGIYLDSTTGNTNTVLGVDGTAKNAVSTLVAARTLADALGHHRYYLINKSTFLGATVDLGATHLGWEFIGIAHQNSIGFGGQQLTGSYFENLDVEGALHASGGHIMFQRCVFGDVTSNFAGHAYESILGGTITMKVARDVYFVDCASAVAGNVTPTIDLSGGSSIVQIRNYSGGIRLLSGSNNDTVSVETDGQIIISANNTSLVITARGMASITDSGTTTVLTQDAVWNRGSVDTVFIPAMVDSNWEELVADHTTPLTYGDSLPKVIQNIIDSILTASDNIGINWADVSNQATVVNLINTTVDLTTDAVDADAVAADGADEIAEKVWFDIDTTNVDSSKIGEWLVNNLGGGGGGSDTSSIKTMMFNNIFARLSSDTTLQVKADGTINGGVVDSNRTEQGGIAGATIPFLVYTIDTSGTDDTVSITSVGLRDATGSPKDGGATFSDGSIQFTVTSGTWNVSAAQNGFHFDDSNYVVTTTDTVALYGYNLTVPAPPSADMCTVHGTVRSNGVGVRRAKLIFIPPVGESNTCDTTLTFNEPVETWTDGDGNFSVALVKSKCFNGLEYTVTVYSNETIIVAEQSFAVPDNTTFLLWY